jgi:hypothetical protein
MLLAFRIFRAAVGLVAAAIGIFWIGALIGWKVTTTLYRLIRPRRAHTRRIPTGNQGT